jgi:RimJ/RimL family protein N-acetyltransferase
MIDLPPPSSLAGERIVLDPFREPDVDDRYVGWLNDPEVTRFLEVRFAPQTRETALAFVRSFTPPAPRYMWAVRAQRDGCIGTATLQMLNRIHGFGELGIMIGERTFWGGTTAIDVLSLVIGFAFRAVGLRRVNAGTYSRHWGMNLVYKQLGFTLEGTIRRAYQIAPGEYVDGYRWGLLADEWKGSRHV